MRLRVAAVAVPALLALVAPAPALAAPKGTVTVTASGNASRSITLTRETTFDIDRATASGGGPVAAFFLVAVRNDGFGAVGATFWQDGSTTSVRRSSRTTVPAGRYVLRVTARGPVRFTVPVTGLPTTTWRPTGPLTVREYRPTWTTDTGPTVVGAADVPLTASSLVIMRVSYRATTAGEHLRVCVGAPERPPFCTAGEGVYVKDVPRTAEPDGAGSFLVVVHAPAAGTHSARWHLTGYGALRDIAAWATVVG